ncbi:MAG: DNA (cytosine-5-)-methyltransferase [Acidimicrobiia bacterium]|nr:DNA (cytosine-5-)-methyltransferase [Acidimicrobiia bacterium]MYC58051.1 DNA (cytosine-5-)-methyltransferase [Acidimicrobiia bacterium]MYI30776.1 DNA (cytosine-5-)-methyltransferase [Acidimicrobiia bacterium]
MSLVAVDLFSGCGGLSTGLDKAGINVVEAYDCWPQALDVYRRNVGDHAVELDLSDTDTAVKWIAETRADLVVGSPPCQDFSTAGKRVEAEQANLTTAFAQIVCEYRPMGFLMENVPQVRNSFTYGRMRRDMAGAGYSLVEMVLDASRFGVPQLRRRFFAFGHLGNGAICNRFVNGIEARQTRERLTVKEYLSDEIDIEFYYRHPRNYSRRSVFSVHEPSPTVRGVNRPVPPHYTGNHLDSVSPNEVRPLTTYERGRVQTFPSAWEWCGGDRNADAELLIGNAVPVQLAAHVGAAICDAID